MRVLLASAGLALLLALATGPSVSAQEAPDWMKQTLPDQVVKRLFHPVRGLLCADAWAGCQGQQQR